MKTYTATLIYSESLLKKAVFSFWWRSNVPGYLMGALLGIITLGQAILSWRISTWAMVLALLIIVSLVQYFVDYHNNHNIFKKFRKLEDGTIQFTVTETNLSFISHRGAAATVPWDEITELWKFEHYWLIFFSRTQFSTLPLESIPADMQAFIIKCIVDSGIKIK
ncbi:hypothetical protein C9426_21795 [Serratia sp. S1B]|nr:hypothetical protein C9426_21795 [Serratia sp. S1B]